MKTTLLMLWAIAMLSSCGQQNAANDRLQTEIADLQSKLDSTYRPGLGEFMLGIQMHHAKLWFAGQARNWKLADFEMGEIAEAIASIKQYNSDRPEVKSISMIAPAIDSLGDAIKKKDAVLFNSSFVSLTNSCNNCHRATSHEFNVIKIPDVLPVSNQVFKLQ
jgi:hypothetical protein